MRREAVDFIQRKIDEQKFFMCLDAGGSKTIIEFFNSNGKRLEHCDQKIPSNISFNEHRDGGSIFKISGCKMSMQSTQTFREELLFVLNLFPTDPKNIVVLAGVSGLGTPQAQQQFSDLLQTLGIQPDNIMAKGDIDTTLLSQAPPVVSLIAGTGSACMGYNGEQLYRAGGNGSGVLSDPGSGHHIGLMLLNTMMHEEQNPHSILKGKLYQAVKQHAIAKGLISSQDETLLSFRSQLNGEPRISPAIIASFSPIAFQFAFEKQHSTAVNIIEEASRGLAKQLAFTLTRMNTRNPITVLLIGGLFTSKFSQKFIGKIQHYLQSECTLNSQHWRDNLSFENASKSNLISIFLRKVIRSLAIKPKKITQSDQQQFPLTQLFRQRFMPESKLGGPTFHSQLFQQAATALPGVKSTTLLQGAEHLEDFLKSMLTTESAHPTTKNMAELAQDDATLPNIIQSCITVDVNALKHLKKDEQVPSYLNSPLFKLLINNIKKTLEQGGRIFFAGCGSSGRLSLLLEKYCREHLPEAFQDRIVAMMAGGDFALVRAIEHFEDNGEYAMAQLRTQEFDSEKDLFVGVSASGSAKFIKVPIRAQATFTAGRAELEHLKPWLICTNNSEKLLDLKKAQFQQARKSDRAAKASHPLADCNEQMHCLGLDVGSCALAGSSRMQPATVSVIALYEAIFQATNQIMPTATLLSENSLNTQLDTLIGLINSPQFKANLHQLIITEDACYKEDRFLMYRCKPDFALSVFTDLTERAPTFKLPKIENSEIEQEHFASCSMSINGASSNINAFQKMLGRTPFSLAWHDGAGPSIAPQTNPEMIAGFDFQEDNLSRREALTKKDHDTLTIEHTENTLKLTYISPKNPALNCILDFNVANLNPFFIQIFLKLLLNTHSTLVMGRQKKYKSNLMTNLNISNAKLFARVVRLVRDQVVATLDDKGLHELSTQITNPSIEVTHGVQAIAMMVADEMINEDINPDVIDTERTLVDRIACRYIETVLQQQAQHTKSDNAVFRLFQARTAVSADVQASVLASAPSKTAA